MFFRCPIEGYFVCFGARLRSPKSRFKTSSKKNSTSIERWRNCYEKERGLIPSITNINKLLQTKGIHNNFIDRIQAIYYGKVVLKKVLRHKNYALFYFDRMASEIIFLLIQLLLYLVFTLVHLVLVDDVQSNTHILFCFF